MPKQIHIISFTIPDPPDYGGAIDVFYKIKALAEAGCQIHLHAFQYDQRQPSATLESWCESVSYYPRLQGLEAHHPFLPYIVSSRRHPQLIQNLLRVEAPVMFEGLHTSYLAKHPALAARKKLLRSHNIEWQYYQQLANLETNFIRKSFFHLESIRLKQYMHILKHIQTVLCISENDWQYHRQVHPEVEAVHLPAFHAFEQVFSQPGTGAYALFHGDFTVSENREAVNFLVNEIWQDLSIPLLLAGKNPPAAWNQFPEYIRIIPNPDQATLHQLIIDAQVHVLPAQHQSGLKLKWLHALFGGRHILVNQPPSESAFGKAMQLATQAAEFKTQLIRLMQLPFTEQDVQVRKQLLENYQNKKLAQTLINTLC